MKTTLPREADLKKQWFVIDATDKPAGRLAVRIANILRGKTKPIYTPHMDTGDFVVVINAAKVKLSGRKDEQKKYQSYSGFPGGHRFTKAGVIRARKPAYLIAHAVKDMLPRNKLSRQLIRRLKIYAGAEHPHAAQNPQAIGL
jgi:large subunit ribosomal protein L13